MNNILATSKVYGNFQTSIPKEIRKNFNIDKNTILEWELNDEGKTVITFRTKRDIKNIVGAFSLDEKTNSVDLKKSLYK